MGNKIQIFKNADFGEIRTVMIDGEPWFVSKDIAKKLGYKNTNQAVKDNTDSDDRGVSPVETPSGIQKMVIINESGLYSLIFGSQLESAKKFKRWVTNEVLPALRKNGSYSIAEAPKLPTNAMELLELHYQALKEVDSKVYRLEREFDEFKRNYPLSAEDCTQINNAVKARVLDVVGGIESNAYYDSKILRKVYRDIYSKTNRAMGVRTYKNIHHGQKDEYIYMVRDYEPTIDIISLVEQSNLQNTLEL